MPPSLGAFSQESAAFTSVPDGAALHFLLGGKLLRVGFVCLNKQIHFHKSCLLRLLHKETLMYYACALY